MFLRDAYIALVNPLQNASLGYGPADAETSVVVLCKWWRISRKDQFVFYEILNISPKTVNTILLHLSLENVCTVLSRAQGENLMLAYKFGSKSASVLKKWKYIYGMFSIDARFVKIFKSDSVKRHFPTLTWLTSWIRSPEWLTCP